MATTAAITLSGVQVIDGVTVGNADERVLVKNQTDQTTNGIYVANTGTWTRAPDAQGNTDWTLGTVAMVSSGTVNGGIFFRQTNTDNPVVIGTSLIAFSAQSQFGGISITPQVGLTTGIAVLQSVSGTSAAQFAANTILITDTAALGGGNFGIGLEVAVTLASTAVQGGREAFLAAISVASPTSASGSNTNHNFVANQSLAVASTPDGGTDPTNAGTSKGALFANSADAGLLTGATAWANVTGFEFNTFIQTGASAWAKTLAQFSAEVRDRVQGSQIDAMLWFYNQGASNPGWKNGLLFDDGGAVGFWPFLNTSTLLKAGTGTSALGTGIDLSGCTITTAAYKSTGFTVDGSGNISAVGNITSTAGNFTTGGNINVGAGAAFYWLARSLMLSPADGIIELTNNAATGFTRLQFGGTTSSFPAIKRNAAALNFRLADDSADAAVTALTYGVGANQVVGARITGYAAMTGTPNKGTVYDTATVTLAQLAGRMMQLQADLTTHGLIGA